MNDSIEGGSSLVESAPTRERPPSFEFDDAFSDGDDHNDIPGFSPDIIREEMAKNHSGIEDRWVGTDLEPELPHIDGFFNSTHDISVSTLDLEDPPSTSPPQSPAPISEETDPATFSPVSLSGGAVDNVDPNELSPYPSVVIDASKPLGDCVEVMPHRPRSPNLQIQPPSPDKEGPPSSSLHSAPNPTQSSSEKFPSFSAPSPPSSAPGPPLAPKRQYPTGPSAFEKVISRTRPPYLPPKPRQEDNKHLADWQTMMKQSRTAGK